MSDYHIQESAIDLKTIRAIYHIPVPVGSNTVGISWRNALVAYKGGADEITSELLGIPSADLTAMKAGELLEHCTTYRFSVLELTDAEKLAEIKAAYTTARTSLITVLQVILKYYGYAGDI